MHLESNTVSQPNLNNNVSRIPCYDWHSRHIQKSELYANPLFPSLCSHHAYGPGKNFIVFSVSLSILMLLLVLPNDVAQRLLLVWMFCRLSLLGMIPTLLHWACCHHLPCLYIFKKVHSTLLAPILSQPQLIPAIILCKIKTNTIPVCLINVTIIYRFHMHQVINENTCHFMNTILALF